MKKIVRLKCTFVAIICLLAFFCSCSSNNAINYYSNKESYVSVTGIVSHIKYNDDNSALYFGFSELNPTMDDTTFKIVGENLLTVQNNQIDDHVKIGTRMTFVTAPRYFGDGYVMPIVAVFVDGECLLSFEEGYHNLLDWLYRSTGDGLREP